MALNARRREGSVVRFKEDHAYDIVPYVPFPLKLLRVMPLIRKKRRHVEHDLYAPPVCIHRVEASQVVDSVQPSLVFVKT